MPWLRHKNKRTADGRKTVFLWSERAEASARKMRGISHAGSEVLRRAGSHVRKSGPSGYLRTGMEELNAAHQNRQQSLLKMQSIFCLRENQGLFSFDHFFADFQAAIGGQAVQHDRVIWSVG